MNLIAVLTGNVLTIIDVPSNTILSRYSFERFRSDVEHVGKNFNEVVNNWIRAICNNLNIKYFIDEEGIPVIL
jgi:hypothetical protein